jgi:hypothetical protein
MVYVARGGATTKSTAAPSQAAKGGNRGVCKYVVGYLPSGAVEGEDGKMPWKNICWIWEQENTDKDDATRTYKTYAGSTMVAEDDPEFLQTKYRMKADADGPILVIEEGRRLKKAGARGADGREFAPQKDAKILRMIPSVTQKGKVIPKSWDCEDPVTHDRYRIREYHTKQEWNEIMAVKDKPRVGGAEAVFG